MDEIAAAAGTSKSIVYRYFEDKTGLQIAVAELVISDISAALDAAASAASNPREGLRSMIDVYLAMVEHSPNVYFFVTRPVGEDASGRVGHFLEAITRLVAEPFARIVAGSEEIDTSAADRVAAWAAGAVGFVRGAGEWWLAHRGEPGTPDRETLTAQVTAWLWAGPVGLLAREHPRSTTASPTTPTTAPAHPADQHPTGGDDAAHTPREQR